jgi:hypothetical protein
MAGEAELRLREQLSRLRSLPLLRGAKLSGELERLQKQLDRIVAEPSDEEIWHSVELARHPDRPYTLDYVERLLDDWFELHGDHHHGDDAALVAGLGRFRGRTVVLLGNQKGRDVKERTRRNFGMAYPEGYGKAMRAMELAERHGFPILSLIDIPGAYPGVVAEQHGQGGAIARSQAELARRLGRRDRDGARRLRADAGERDLHGHLARGLRGDPLARRGRGSQGRCGVQARRRALPRAGRDRRDRARAGRGRAHRPGRVRAAAGRRFGRVARATRGPVGRGAETPATCAIPHNRPSPRNPLETAG